MTYGAAVPAAILHGDKFGAVQDLTLPDATPLSLHIGGMMTGSYQTQYDDPDKADADIHHVLRQSAERTDTSLRGGKNDD